MNSNKISNCRHFCTHIDIEKMLRTNRYPIRDREKETKKRATNQINTQREWLCAKKKINNNKTYENMHMHSNVLFRIRDDDINMRHSFWRLFFLFHSFSHSCYFLFISIFIYKCQRINFIRYIQLNYNCMHRFFILRNFILAVLFFSFHLIFFFGCFSY